jgi:hypothetical protein
MPLHRIMNHQDPPRHKDSNHHRQSSDFSLHGILHQMTASWSEKSYHMMVTGRSFATLPLKPNGQIKTRERATKSNPI